MRARVGPYRRARASKIRQGPARTGPWTVYVSLINYRNNSLFLEFIIICVIRILYLQSTPSRSREGTQIHAIGINYYYLLIYELSPLPNSVSKSGCSSRKNWSYNQTATGFFKTAVAVFLYSNWLQLQFFGMKYEKKTSCKPVLVRNIINLIFSFKTHLKSLKKIKI